MTELQSTETAYYRNLETVVELYATGHRVSEIQQKTGFTRVQIEEYLATFRQYAQQDAVLRERAKEAVRVVDVHYSEIVRGMHDAVESADLNNDYKVKITGLKAIADVEAKRVELLQKAGLLSDDIMGDQLAEMEQKQAILIGILKDVTGNCDHCKIEVAKRLSKVTGNVEGVMVDVKS